MNIMFPLVRFGAMCLGFPLLVFVSVQGLPRSVIAETLDQFPGNGTAKTGDREEASLNDTIVYTIILDNSESSEATGLLSVRDKLPSELEIDKATLRVTPDHDAPDWNEETREVTWTGELTDGELVEITYTAKIVDVPESKRIVNEVSVFLDGEPDTPPQTDVHVVTITDEDPEPIETPTSEPTETETSEPTETPTSEPTSTETPEPTGTPDLRKAHLPIVQKPYPFPTPFPTIANGGFEKGQSEWVENNSEGREDPLILEQGSPVLPDGVVANTGRWLAWLGGFRNATTSIEQEITLPFGEQVDLYNIQLEFYQDLFSFEPCATDGTSRDFAEVSIDDEPFARYELCDDNNTTDWEHRIIDLNSEISGTVILSFSATLNDDSNSNWFVDDIRLCSDYDDAPDDLLCNNERTVTPTPSLTPTPTSTPTPPFPSIVNGDFESPRTEGEVPGWEESGVEDDLILCKESGILPNALNPRSPQCVAWLGGFDGQTTAISQTVTIDPYYLGKVKLKFYYALGSSEQCGASDDRATVYVNGAPAEQAQIPELCDGEDTPGWPEVLVDLGDLSGDVAIKFEVAQNGSLNSNWFLDDVSLCSDDANLAGSVPSCN